MPQTLDSLSDRYDVVVIGGGLGGLTAARRLAYFERKVLLLEQHFALGGLAAYFKRKGHIFDVALHGFPWGMVKTCRKYWSKELADSIVQLERIVFDNPQFHLETTFDKDDFTRKLTDHFGVAPATVGDFFSTLDKMNFYDDQSMNTRALFERFFPGRSDIVRFLMEPITYANGSTLDEPAITYGIVFSNFMNKGVFTVRGGTDLFIETMRRELEAAGVDIVLRAPVEKILVENGRVAGVRVDGRSIRADAVLSNANLKRTVLEMIPGGALPGDFREATEAMRLSNSSCQVYMGIRRGESVPEIGDLIFTSTYPAFDPDALCAREVTSRTYSLYYPKTRPGSERYTVVSSMNARYEDWNGLAPEEYRERKRVLCATTLDDLERHLPGISEKVDYVEAATPLTFARYTGHLGGASFGTKFEGLKISENLSQILPGAFHAGSCAIIMSGWLGAANYGVIVANNVEEYLDRSV